jgi:VacB/RNase II family 3'-5' exoribonuclease
MTNSTPLSTDELILKLITSSTVKYRDLSTLPISEPLDRKKILNTVNKMIKQKQLKLNHNGTLSISRPQQLRKSIIGTVSIDGKVGLVRTKNSSYPIFHKDIHKCLHGEQVSVDIIKSNHIQQAHLVAHKQLLENISGQLFIDNKQKVPKYYLGFNSLHKIQVTPIFPEKSVIPNAEQVIVDKAFVVGDLKKGDETHSPRVFVIHKIISQTNIFATVTEEILEKKGMNHELVNELERDAIDLYCSEINSKNTKYNQEFLSIDSSSTKEIDDLISASQTTNGYRVIVAISDVSRYVTVGSSVDLAAKEMFSSTCIAGRSYSMLPETLSKNALSMLPNAERDALLVDMQLDYDGNIVSFEFSEALVRSTHKLSYRLVDDIHLRRASFRSQQLSSNHELTSQIDCLFEIKNKLLVLKGRRGATSHNNDYSSSPRFNESGLAGYSNAQRTDSHLVVEEIMCLANICAAKFLKDSGIPALYRHSPHISRTGVYKLNNLLKQHKLSKISAKTNPAELSNRRTALPLNKQARFDLILNSSQGNARYDHKHSEHFRLVLPEYTHFTSPLRRYPDIVVHRAIKAKMASLNIPVTGAYHYGECEIKELAVFLSDRGARVRALEREVTSSLYTVWTFINSVEPLSAVISGISSAMISIKLLNTHIYCQIPIHIFASKINGSPAVGQNIDVNVIGANWDDYTLSVEPCANH